MSGGTDRAEQPDDVELDANGISPASRYEGQEPTPRPVMPEGARGTGGLGARARQFEPGDRWVYDVEGG